MSKRASITTKIERINSQYCKVNGKEVCQNKEGEWKALGKPLTKYEWKQFYELINEFQ